MQTITLPPPKRSWFSLISWAVLLAVLVISWKGAEMDPLLLFRDSGNMATFAADFFPPDFSQWQDYLGEMAITLQIAVWGTALAVILSIPFGLMSAKHRAMVGLPADAPPDGRLSRHQRNGLCDAVRGRRRPGSVRGRDGAVHPHHRRALQAALRSG